MVIVLVTGPPGCGKTTVVRRTVELLERRGLEVRGLLTGELRDATGARMGFRLEPVGAGEPRTAAHRDFVSRQRVGRYGVDVEIIDYVSDTALSARALADANVVVIDEVGKMQCLSQRFVSAVRRHLDSDRPSLLTVASRGDGLIAELAERADAQLVELSPGVRDALPERLTQLLTRA